MFVLSILIIAPIAEEFITKMVNPARKKHTSYVMCASMCADK